MEKNHVPVSSGGEISPMLDKLVWVSTWTSYSQLATFWSLTTAKWIQADEFVRPGYDWLCGRFGRKGLPKFILSFFVAGLGVCFSIFRTLRKMGTCIKQKNTTQRHTNTPRIKHVGFVMYELKGLGAVVCVDMCAYVWRRGWLSCLCQRVCMCEYACETTEVLGVAGQRADLKLNDDSNEWGCNDLRLQRLVLIQTCRDGKSSRGLSHTHIHTR